MKKFLVVLLALVTFCSFSMEVIAADVTTLTTTVPEVAYTLVIPADTEITFGCYATSIDAPKVLDASGFAEGKNLSIKVNYDGLFKSEDVSTTISYYVDLCYKKSSQNYSCEEWKSDTTRTFRGLYSGGLEKLKTNDYSYDIEYLQIKISSKNWGKALAGNYSTTLTFTTEVVVEE